MANPRISDTFGDERGHAASDAAAQQARRQRNLQRKAAIIAACAVGFVGVGFGGLLVHAHMADSRRNPEIQVVKVKTVPVVANAAKPAVEKAVIVADASRSEAVLDDSSADEADVVTTGKTDSVSAAALPVEAEVPAAEDPRWARSAKGAVAQMASGGPAGSALAALAPVEPTGRAAGVLAGEAENDTETAAIEPDEPRQPKKPARSAVSGAAPTRMAVVSADVRMRAGRSAGSAVVGVVPRGTEVGVVDCEGWCEVVYAGKRGFVYKKFVGGGKLTTAAKGTTPKDNDGLWLFGRNSNDNGALAPQAGPTTKGR